MYKHGKRAAAPRRQIYALLTRKYKLYLRGGSPAHREASGTRAPRARRGAACAVPEVVCTPLPTPPSSLARSPSACSAAGSGWERARLSYA